MNVFIPLVAAKRGFSLRVVSGYVKHSPIRSCYARAKYSARNGGYADRALFTDKDEAVIESMRPIVVNGITPFITALIPGAIS